MESGRKLLLLLKIQNLIILPAQALFLKVKLVLMQEARGESMVPCCVCQAIFSATANLFEGPEDRKQPIYSIDGIHSRLFKLAGSMVTYLIIHLDASIPCLSTTVYKNIESGSISPEFCSVDDVLTWNLGS